MFLRTVSEIVPSSTSVFKSSVQGDAHLNMQDVVRRLALAAVLLDKELTVLDTYLVTASPTCKNNYMYTCFLTLFSKVRTILVCLLKENLQHFVFNRMGPRSNSMCSPAARSKKTVASEKQLRAPTF